MIFSIILFLFFAVIYYNYNRIRSCYRMYATYKSLIDPSNKMSHCEVLKSIFDLFFGIYKKNDTEENKEENKPQKFNKTLMKIPYKYKDKTYFYLLKIPKGFPPVQKIEDDGGNDISDQILPYLGPNLDCHNTKISPMDFGYSKVVVTTIYDKVITFEENDTIVLEFN